jgi:hypothetical protein
MTAGLAPAFFTAAYPLGRGNNKRNNKRDVELASPGSQATDYPKAEQYCCKREQLQRV